VFGPTARPLATGEGYVGFYGLFLPAVQVGVTNRLSLGAGTTLMPFDAGVRPLFLTPKYTFYQGGPVSAAAGVLHVAVFGAGVSGGIAYAVTTIGGPDRALTLGIERAYIRYRDDGVETCTAKRTVHKATCIAERRTYHGSAPLYSVGVEQRFASSWRAVAEAYVVDNVAVVSAGVKGANTRSEITFGLMMPVGVGPVIPAPVINYVRRF